MVFLAGAFLALNRWFTDHQLYEDINSGRTALPLAELGGISSLLPIPFLQTILKLFVTPNFAPPDWFPVLPFRLQNPGDLTSWTGEPGNYPADPRDDPFYHPDVSTYQDKKNGDVLNIREVGVSAIWASVAKAYQISYRTESTLGWPQADVTTVMLPHKTNGKVVSYQNWEDASSLQCSPSYSIITGIADPTFDILLLLGYVVNWPDHEGVNSSYVAGIKEGQSTLDSVRAFLNAREQVGLDKDGFDKIVIWGYSGGAIATGHAAESQPSYAPELKDNLVGAVIGGYITNITQVVNSVNGGLLAGVVFAGVAGLATEYPTINEVIDEAIRPGIRWRWNQVSKVCFVENVINSILQNVWSYTDDASGQKYLNDARVYEPMQKEWLGVHAAPEIPVIIYQGVQDEFVDVYDVDRVVNYYCSNGVHVDYYRLGLLEHGGTAVLSFVDALTWVAKLFNGYVPGTCSSASDATKATSPSYNPKDHGQYENIVYGKWDDILKIDGIRPSSS